MSSEDILTADRPDDFGSRVKSAVFWRSGTQILSQVISWGVTLAIFRILDPSDYGLFAMSAVVLVFLNFLNGYGIVSSLIQADEIEPIRIRQAFGILILLNVGLALFQLFIAAPLAAGYFHEPKVAELLRWQSLIYLATPFLILPEAMMTRNLDFRKPAIINLTSAAVGAGVSLAMALMGYGVWTLVFAPISIFWTRAIMLMVATRFFVVPSFNFKGAGEMVGFGAALLASHGFWIIQSQSDIFIAGRVFNQHELGLYAETIFLAQIFAAKFVPPLNEVAFPAYSRLQKDKGALAAAFLKTVRLIMLVACPLYIGMAVTGRPFAETVMGIKFIEATPMVPIVALAMPVMTLQILFAPALNALGLPKVTMRNSILGAILMPTVYLIAVRYGLTGLAWGWCIAFPLLLAFTIIQAKPHIGFRLRGLAAAVAPGLGSALVMGAIVWTFDRLLLVPQRPDISAPIHLAILASLGGVAYAAMLWWGARDTAMELIDLLVKRKPPEPALA